MQNTFKVLLIIFIAFILYSCLGDGDIGGPSPDTWICTINVDGSGLKYLFKGGGDFRFNSDGSKIIIGLRNNGFKIIDAESGTVLTFIDTLSNVTHYTVSNNDAICFSSSSVLANSKDLSLYYPNNSTISNITMTDSLLENDPCFSANGEEIVFFRTGSLPELVIYNTINQQFVTISNNDSYIFPQFSFNGNHIIYRNFQSYNLIDINGQNQIFTFEGYTEYYPCSIFENEMTFSSDNQIIKMNIDGTELMNLGVGNHPQFSPDGSKIAFDGLSVMNSDGTERQTLTDEIGEYPHFSPDGTKIVFIMERYEE